jgi:uncharacterized radical SAM protein YgiQ
MDALGWDSADVILFSGDAYIDHPSFGIAIIARVLEFHGYKVAVVPQPNWKDDLRDFKKLGKPNLFFGVSSGNMDSMVNHYTANKRLRHNDAYTPGNRHGARPNRATTVYSKILKELYPEVPVVIGGIEASLRRFCHYDYWSDSLRPSILIESHADLLVYGMGESAINNIANQLKAGKHIEEIKSVPQTAYIANKPIENAIELDSFEICKKDKIRFAQNFMHIETESNKIEQNGFTQKHGNQYVNVIPPSAKPHDLDTIYDLPYNRTPHPRYRKKAEIPAYQMIRHSITTHRGCFGGCSFCTISAHQGKQINSRSERSILNEVDQTTKMSDFKGYISDIGGPSANMYRMNGINTEKCRKCKRNSCIHPTICENLNVDHTPNMKLLSDIEKHPNIKKVFIGSGIRYDLIYAEKRAKLKESGLRYLNQVIKNHTSGRLKVAPEHTSKDVLNIMRKPDFKYFRQFYTDFQKINKKENLNQQLIPYFISSHPGCSLNDMADLALDTYDLGYKLEQSQDFTPTPMTLANVLFYAGHNPYSQKKIYIPKSKNQKIEQQKMMFWYKKENRKFIEQTLIKLNKREYIKSLFSFSKSRNH